jgi:two-component system LytT family response regulator
MKMRAYLVDDEPLALERLSRLLEESGRAEVVGRTTEPEEAVAALTATEVDVCFLDIHMPRLDGFGVLSRLAVQPMVIFTTAHDEYALKAFAVNSVDYLLKPVDPERLAKALTKVEKLRSGDRGSQLDWRAVLQELSASLRQKAKDYPQRIASRLGERLWFIDLERVTHFYAEEKLTYAVADGKAYCVDQSIAQLEERLDPRKFVRIHRRTLLNVAWVSEVTSLPGGGLNVRLKDGKRTDLVVARDRAREFREQLSL